MSRLPGFDYKRPFFYMVTLKGAWERPHSKPFCSISPEGEVVPNAITEAFETTIAEWAAFWRSVESVSPYVIMPDHLHLLVKLADVEKAVSLPVVVGDLRKRLNRAYWQVLQLPASAGCVGGAAPQPAFDPDWHDWIVKKVGQLAAFRKYILDNPPRHARRQANRQYFTKAREIPRAGYFFTNGESRRRCSTIPGMYSRT